MSKRTFTNETLGVTFALPEPLLGRHWEAYWRAYRQAEEQQATNLAARYAGAAAIIEDWSGDGIPQLPQTATEVDLRVVSWVGHVVSEALIEAATVPGN